MKKRLLAWVLSFALALSLLPVGVLAAEETPGWQEAYQEYIRSDLEDTAGNGSVDSAKETARYFLFDVNEDSVPELWIDYSTSAYGKRLCSYVDGQVKVQNVAYGGLSYLPGESLAYTSGGHMGHFWDTVYRLENGSFKAIGEGLLQIVDDNGYEVSENEYRYTWNNQSVDKETYEKNLNAAFDASKAVELPQNGGQTYQEILDTLDTSKIPPETLYKQILDKYKTGVDEKWTIQEFSENNLAYVCGYRPEYIGYVFMDLDGNGIKELIIGDTEYGTDGVIYALYSYADGSVKEVVSSGERDRHSLCEGNAIYNDGSSGALNSVSAYYRLSGTTLSLIERVVYDGYTDKNNPYFYGTTENDEDLVSIMEEQAQKIKDSYVKKSIEYTSFAEYGVSAYQMIDVFSGYDAETKQVFFPIIGEDLPYQKFYVTEETDTSFLEHSNDLIGQPVAVRYTHGQGNEMHILSINPVERVFGYLSSVSDTEVTIDGKIYPISYTFNKNFFPAGYEGWYVVCYLQDGAAISMENINRQGESGGVLESWDSDTGIAKINGQEYMTSALSDLPEYMDQLVGRYVFFFERSRDSEENYLLRVTFQSGIYISSNAVSTTSLEIGKTMDLYVNYYQEDGSEASDLEGFTAMASDSDVVDITANGWHEKYGQHFTVRAKNLGTTTISFLMAEPEARSLTIGVTVVPEKVVYKFDNVPTHEYEEGKITNFYNYNGMVINDFAYTLRQGAAGENYTVTMTAYNSLNLYGTVTSYDADGTLIDFAIIDKNEEMPSSFVDSVQDLVFEIGDLFCLVGNEKYYSGKSITKETKVSVEVPAGGYLVISNNTSSGLPALANLTGLVLDTASSSIDFGTGAGNLGSDVKQKIIMNVVKNTLVDKGTGALLDSAKEQLKDPDWTMENYGEGISAYVAQLSNVGIDFLETLSNEIFSVTGVAGISESVLLKFIPTGSIINFLYDTLGVLDQIVAWNAFMKSAQTFSNGIYIYSPFRFEDDSYLVSNGVNVSTSVDEGDAVLHSYLVVDDKEVTIPADGLPEETYQKGTYETYNIAMYKKGTEAQPSGEVTVQIPISDAFKHLEDNKIHVYGLNEDGSLTDMNEKVENGYAVFNTRQLGYYVLAYEGEPSEVRNITIAKTTNGTLTANPTSAAQDDTVTLTATPNAGYRLASLTVADEAGNPVSLTSTGNGTYTFTMPASAVTVSAAFTEIPQQPEQPEDPDTPEQPEQPEDPDTPEQPAEPFTDVSESDWFYDEVVYVYANGLMDGVGDNRFAPNTTTNRAMLATILYRLAGEPDVSGDLPFTDVAAGTWYTDAVLWAAQNGIVNGLGENTFAPMNTLTREQLVTMLYRYAEGMGYDVSASADLSGFPDTGDIQSYATQALSWAVAEGLLQGFEDDSLQPQSTATRAQIATILMRFCETVAK